jgi:hypothetical protein
MKTIVLKLIPYLVLVVAGFGVASYLRRPKPGKPETPAVAVRQKDGSLELERAPSGISSTAPAGSIPLKPEADIPKGAKVERVVEVTVQPRSVPQGTSDPGIPQGLANTLKIPTLGGLGGAVANVCPPVRVDLSLIRLKDKSQRVLASSPDGQVVGGIDVPIAPLQLPRVARWTAEGLAGYDSNTAKNVFGGQVSYSRGPFVLSGGAIGGTVFAGAGIKF